MEDATIVDTKRKQLRLFTIHEKLGHLNFTTLKLMARCAMVPTDLAHVDTPTCLGYAYDKAHHQQTCHKGMRNIKHLHQVHSLGVVVSIDQLVSPTKYFVPIHRGAPYCKAVYRCHCLCGSFFRFYVRSSHDRDERQIHCRSQIGF